MPTPENKVKKEATDVLTRLGVWYFMPGATMYGRRGISDIVAVVNGLVLFVEVKSTRGEVTKMQEFFLKEAADKGGAYTMVFWPGDARALEHRITTMQRRSLNANDQG